MVGPEFGYNGCLVAFGLLIKFEFHISRSLSCVDV